MAPSNKVLVIVFIILVLVLTGELAYIFISRNRAQIQKETSTIITPIVNPTTTPIPTSDLPEDVPQDQSYRLPETPDRLRKFLTKALYSFLIELSDHAPTKSVNIKVDSTYEGTVKEIVQGEEVKKLYPPNPNRPKSDVAVVITVSDQKNESNTKEDIEILIAKIEMENVKITNEKGDKLDLKDLKNKSVKINRIVELPANKTNDIVTLDPIVYTNIVVLGEK